MICLEGKKALITGGSRGIGRATAILFAQAGADVAINFLSKEQAALEVEKKVRKLGRDFLALKADISLKDQVEGLVETLIHNWNKIDILVNNAGIWTYGEIGSMDYAIWHETMQLNLDAVFFLCNAVVPVMKEQKMGGIINVSSTAGVRRRSHENFFFSRSYQDTIFLFSLKILIISYFFNLNNSSELPKSILD